MADSLTPEIVSAVTAVTGDQGAACRALRASCWHMRMMLPATFPDPVAITLAGPSPAPSAVHHGSIDVLAGVVTCTTALQDEVKSQCSWPLIPLWQQQQQQQKQQHRDSTLQLERLKLQLGPNLKWLNIGGAATNRGSCSAILQLPDCPLLQQEPLLEHLTSITVTYVHDTTSCDRSPTVCAAGNSTAVISDDLSSGWPAPSLIDKLLSSAAPLASFMLQPRRADAQGNAFWAQNTTPTGSNGSSRTDQPCANVCFAAGFDLCDLMGASVLGSSWLPQLLQLQQLKHLVLPVVLLADEQQQYTALHPILAAAAPEDGVNSRDRRSNSFSSLEVLELLLVPARSAVDTTEGATALSGGPCTPMELQKLLQPLTMLQQLQQLHITVLSNDAAQPAAVVAQLARKLKTMFPLLQIASFTIMRGAKLTLSQLQANRATWNYSSCSISSMCGSKRAMQAVQYFLRDEEMSTMQRAALCHQVFGAIPLVYPLQGVLGSHLKRMVARLPEARLWAPVADACRTVSVELDQLHLGTPCLWTDMDDEQELQQQRVQLRQLSLSCACNSHQLPVLPWSWLEHVTCLQLAVPQSLLPHLSWLLPERSLPTLHGQSAAAVAEAVRMRSAPSRSGSGMKLWTQLRRLELDLNTGDIKNMSAEPFSWQMTTHQQQQQTLRLLFGVCSRLQTLRLAGSTVAGVSLVPDLQSLAEAASKTLQEVQILHTLPLTAEVGGATGSIPHLLRFAALQKLHLARRAVCGTVPLQLQLLPESLRELHLQGYSLVLGFKDRATAAANASAQAEQVQRRQRMHQHRRTRRSATPVMDFDSSSHGSELDMLTEENVEWFKGRLTAAGVMPCLQHLSLIDCYYASTAPLHSLPRVEHSLSIQQLVAWAGPQLRSLELVNMIGGTGMCFCNGFGTPALPQLRRFTYINSSVAFTGPVRCMKTNVSDVTNYLQANAPELQQLVLILCKYNDSAAVLDEHVPALVSMRLRSMQLHIAGGVRFQVGDEYFHSGPAGMSEAAAMELRRSAGDGVQLFRDWDEVQHVLNKYQT